MCNSLTHVTTSSLTPQLSLLARTHHPSGDVWGFGPAIRLVNQRTRPIQYRWPYLSSPSTTFRSFVLPVYQNSLSCACHRTFTEGFIQRKLAYSRPLSLQMADITHPAHPFTHRPVLVAICGQSAWLVTSAKVRLY